MNPEQESNKEDNADGSGSRYRIPDLKAFSDFCRGVITNYTLFGECPLEDEQLLKVIKSNLLFEDEKYYIKDEVHLQQIYNRITEAIHLKTLFELTDSGIVTVGLDEKGEVTWSLTAKGQEEIDSMKQDGRYNRRRSVRHCESRGYPQAVCGRGDHGQNLPEQPAHSQWRL
jgi:hypothetical protein